MYSLNDLYGNMASLWKRNFVIWLMRYKTCRGNIARPVYLFCESPFWFRPCRLKHRVLNRLYSVVTRVRKSQIASNVYSKGCLFYHKMHFLHYWSPVRNRWFSCTESIMRKCFHSMTSLLMLVIRVSMYVECPLLEQHMADRMSWRQKGTAVYLDINQINTALE